MHQDGEHKRAGKRHHQQIDVVEVLDPPDSGIGTSGGIDQRTVALNVYVTDQRQGIHNRLDAQAP
jgi:hypothetical protein